MNIRYLLLVILILVVITGLAWSIQSNQISASVKTTPVAVLLEEKIVVSKPTLGSLFMIGHWADTPIASTTELIKKYQLGGVIIMSAPEDPNEIATWTETWQAVSSTTLLIAIDQEGGSVSRLRGDAFINTSQPDIGNGMEAYHVGETRGLALSQLGINLNFAPVLDSATEPESFMYDRVFRDRSMSASLASSLISGLEVSGVFSAVKHFPGHADNSDDSHSLLPTVDIPQEELEEFVYPFTELINNDPPRALMTAHVLFPQISDKPATLSSFFLTDYLRDKLGFTGVIITDDLSMQAISDTWAVDQASVMSISAGADLILLAAKPFMVEQALEGLEKAITAGTITYEVLNERISRTNILRSEILKLQRNKLTLNN